MPRSAMVTPNSRFMRAMVIGLWVMVTKRVSVAPRHFVEQVAEALDIGVVERRVDLVEHADRRGLVRNTAKISAIAVSACSPPTAATASAASCRAAAPGCRDRPPADLRFRSSCNSAVPPSNRLREQAAGNAR